MFPLFRFYFLTKSYIFFILLIAWLLNDVIKLNHCWRLVQWNKIKCRNRWFLLRVISFLVDFPKTILSCFQLAGILLQCYLLRNYFAKLFGYLADGISAFRETILFLCATAKLPQIISLVESNCFTNR